MKQIKITAMTVYVTDIPVRLMRRHGSGDVAGSVKNAILKLETDAGITGWGDAAPWAVFTGTIEANVAALNVYLRPLLIGADPYRIEQLMADADHAVVGHPEAKAAMEMALFDIVGQGSGLPVAELLGGRCRDDIPLSFSVADPDVDRDMEMVQRLYGEGLRLFKMKTGFAGHAADLKRMERFRKEVPADAELRIDYNQGMAAADAIRQLRDVEAFKPTFIEQPVPGHQRAALAEHHLQHGSVIAEAEAHDGGFRHRFSRGGSAPDLGPCLRSLDHGSFLIPVAVVQRERETGLDQVGGHGSPEGSQTDERKALRLHPTRPHQAAPCLRAARGWRRRRWRCGTSGRPGLPFPRPPPSHRRR